MPVFFDLDYYHARKPEPSIEELRLDYFCRELSNMGFSSKIVWVSDNDYTVVIKKGWWLFSRLVGSISLKPEFRQLWNFDLSVDSSLVQTFKKLYYQSFEIALRFFGISLPIDDAICQAVECFPLILVIDIGVFPVKYIKEADKHIFWVVAPIPLTDYNHSFTCFFCPNIILRQVEMQEYPYIWRHVSLYREAYFLNPTASSGSRISKDESF